MNTLAGIEPITILISMTYVMDTIKKALPKIEIRFNSSSAPFVIVDIEFLSGLDDIVGTVSHGTSVVFQIYSFG
jgi:hypothetical protein